MSFSANRFGAFRENVPATSLEKLSMATLRALGAAFIIAVAATTSVDAMEPALAQLLQLMRTARQNPAPPTIDKDKFQKFLFSDTYKGLIRRAFDSLPNGSFRSCRTLASEKSSVVLLSSISFGADGVPSSGGWRGAFPVKGCDLDTTLNFFFIVAADGVKIETIVAMPGGTVADPILQRDAINYARLGASVASKDCEQFEVIDTRFEAFGLREPKTADPGPNARFRLWWETWTLAGCGRKFDVPLNFIPDERGTTITQALADVKSR